MKSIIPLFILKLIVYPDSKYPLHIFEKRYKSLVNNSLTSGEGFGIVSNIDNRVSEVGCYVQIEKVIKKYENGSMDIIIKGIDRFKILNKTLTENDIFEGTIIPFFDSKLELINSANVSKLIGKFKRIVDYSELTLSSNYWNNLEAVDLKSFKIAEKCGLTLNQQQDLLMIQNENERINYLLNHFEKLDDYISNSNEMKNLIMNDGYIN